MAATSQRYLRSCSNCSSMYRTTDKDSHTCPRHTEGGSATKIRRMKSYGNEPILRRLVGDDAQPKKKLSLVR